MCVPAACIDGALLRSSCILGDEPLLALPVTVTLTAREETILPFTRAWAAGMTYEPGFAAYKV